ncbi:MAG: hypothetical protein WCB12_02965 [Bryobacteraceae bacterium]
MQPLFFSTGQVARQLGTTLANVRALCDAHAIKAETTPGGHLRVAAAEVERLKRDGLPPLPRPLPTESGPLARNGKVPRGNSPLLAAPSEEVIDSAEAVVRLENEVKSLGLRKQKEEQLDWFREREEREAAREAQQLEAEQRRQTEIAAEQRRQPWRMRWLEYALNSIPSNAPQSVRLDVYQAVDDTLTNFEPTQPDSLTRRLVGAAVDRALAPWRNMVQKEACIGEACEDWNLPCNMRHDRAWKARMCEAASAAVGRLRPGASVGEMDAAARQAIVPLAREFEHQRACAEIIASVRGELSGADTAEAEEGKECVQKALAELPAGASRREMEKARDRALELIRGRIAARLDAKMREDVLDSCRWRLPFGMSPEDKAEALAEAREEIAELPAGAPRGEIEKACDRVVAQYKEEQDRKEAMERLIEAGLGEIYGYVQRLEQKWKFDKSTWSLSEELKPAIREALEEELEGDESTQAVVTRVRRLVRQELDL